MTAGNGYPLEINLIAPRNYKILATSKSGSQWVFGWVYARSNPRGWEVNVIGSSATCKSRDEALAIVEAKYWEYMLDKA